jgi:hypothetical protein
MQKMLESSGETLGTGGDEQRASARAVRINEWIPAVGGEVNCKRLQRYNFQIEGSL